MSIEKAEAPGVTSSEASNSENTCQEISIVQGGGDVKASVPPSPLPDPFALCRGCQGKGDKCLDPECKKEPNFPTGEAAFWRGE